MDELINVLKVKYFKTNDIPIIEKNKIDYLMINSETNSDSILHYRKLNEKFGININYKQSPFIMVIPSKSISNENFTYNCNFSLKHSNHSFKQVKKKYKNESSIFPILPVDRARIYFLNKKQWKYASKLPSILAQFERFVLVHQLISTMKLINRNPNENEIKHFTAAVTSPAMTEDYNYEILETLGDSILKFLITFHFFDKYPEYKEGEISKKRNEITKNNYLYEKGRNSCLVNYVFTAPFNLKNWDPPLKFKHVQKYEFSITKKSMADVVEAIMGACFLSKDMFKSCINYLKFIDILSGNNDFSSNYLNKIQELNNSSFLDLSLNNIDFEVDIPFIDLFNCFKLYILESEPDIIENNKEIRKVGRMLKGTDLKDCSKVENIFLELQEKSLNYKFKNRSLLRLAFTHKSIDNDNSYERLEILGDAIVELYIMTTMFHLSENKLNIDENFNPGNLSKVKAFLSSNYFMIRVSVLFRLHEYLMISPSMSKKVEDAEKYINGVNFNQKLNQYEDTSIGRPKIISDIFESLIGAIMVDSNLDECYKVLNMMLGPFVVYCVKYLGRLKYSPIAEFVEMVQEKFKVSPIFTAKKIDEKEIIVEVSIDGKVYTKGVGYTEDSAKEASCINGLKKIK